MDEIIDGLIALAILGDPAADSGDEEKFEKGGKNLTEKSSEEN